MKAICVTELSGPAGLSLVETDLPQRKNGSDDVLVEVRSVGLVYPDVLLSRGLYQVQPRLPFTLGQECSGVVVESDVSSGFSPGDRVVSYWPQGTLAEFVSIPGRALLPLPDDIDFDTGACLPVNYLTTHYALQTRGRLRAEETVLIHGASGGIGLASIHLASSFGAHTIAVVSTQEKAELVRAAGAAEVMTIDEFEANAAHSPRTPIADVVVDTVGGERFAQSLRILRPEGRLLVIGFLSGDIPVVRVNRLLLENLDVIGVGWGFVAHRPGLMRAQWQDVLGLVGDANFRPPISTIVDLRSTPQALQLLEDRQVAGRVVVRVSA